MNSLILYPINYETAPYFVLRNAFASHFSPFEEFDWFNLSRTIGLYDTKKRFLELLKRKRPDYCFMQIQSVVNMDVETIREMAKYTKIINWTGDVRQTPQWYQWFIDIGREIHLTLFTNETDVKIMRAAGVQADYLQVGFDSGWYNKKKHIVGWPDIVFCANHYGDYQLCHYRADAVLALRKLFPGQFDIYGGGWQKMGIETKPIINQLESEAYNSSKIALSISNFNSERYHSDRLLRIMACGGAMPLSHHYDGLEKDYTPGHDIATFYNLQDLIEKCKYYLMHEEERQQIARNAYETAHTKCTWDIRCRELVELLTKYSSSPKIAENETLSAHS